MLKRRKNRTSDIINDSDSEDLDATAMKRQSYPNQSAVNAADVTGDVTLMVDRRKPK